MWPVTPNKSQINDQKNYVLIYTMLLFYVKCVHRFIKKSKKNANQSDPSRVILTHSKPGLEWLQVDAPK